VAGIALTTGLFSIGRQLPEAVAYRGAKWRCSGPATGRRRYRQHDKGQRVRPTHAHSCADRRPALGHVS
jgi:hypothetical protein